MTCIPNFFRLKPRATQVLEWFLHYMLLEYEVEHEGWFEVSTILKTLIDNLEDTK
jgi:hypothetical protein